jgi:hypothetical protein
MPDAAKDALIRYDIDLIGTFVAHTRLERSSGLKGPNE